MIQEEYEKLVSAIASRERVSVQVVKLALTEIVSERYDKQPREILYHAFTTAFPQEEIDRVKRYLTIFLDSTRFKEDYPALYVLIH